MKNLILTLIAVVVSVSSLTAQSLMKVGTTYRGEYSQITRTSSTTHTVKWSNPYNEVVTKKLVYVRDVSSDELWNMKISSIAANAKKYKVVGTTDYFIIGECYGFSIYPTYYATFRNELGTDKWNGGDEFKMY